MTEYVNADAFITSYKQVYQQAKGMCFDEWPFNQVNINVLAEQEGIKSYHGYPIIDVLPHRSYFVGSEFNAVNHSWLVQNNKNFVVCWKKGKISIINLFESGISRQEVCYVHIQKRNLKYIPGHEGKLRQFLVTPNRIIPIYDDNEKINYKLIIYLGKMYSLFHADEICWKIKTIFSLWKHRFNKYICKIE